MAESSDEVHSPLESGSAAERARHLRTALTTVRAQLEAERADGAPTLASLQAELAQAQAHLRRAEEATSAAKDLAKRRKGEIDDWKLWYNALPEAEKEAAFAQLKREIDWRAQELAELTPRISALLAAQAEAGGALELTQQRLQAWQAGVYDRPIEEDPRLRSLEEALAAVGY